MKKNIILIIILISTIFISTEIKAQTAVIDSLKNLLQKHTSKDTVRVNLLYNIALNLLYVNSNQVVGYADEAVELADKINFKKGKAKSLRCMARYFRNNGNFQKALGYFQEAFIIYEEIGNEMILANIYSNIGSLYRKRGNYPIAFDYYMKSLMIYKELGKENETSNIYISIGIIYEEEDNYPKALEYFQKSLNIYEEIGNKNGISISLSNIGVIYQKQGNYFKALEYYENALKIDKESGNKRLIVIDLHNVGEIHKMQGDYTKALEIFLKALDMSKDLRNKAYITCVLCYNISDVYIQMSRYDKALIYSNKGLEAANKLDLLKNQIEIYKQLSEIYAATKNYKKAYQNHLIYEELNDSVFSNKNIRKIRSLELQYEYEKDKLVIELEQQKKDAVYEKELQLHKATKHTFITITILITLITLIVIYNLFRKRKVNRILAEKNNEILIRNEKISEHYNILNEKNNAITNIHAKVKESEEKFRSFFDNNKAVMLQLNAETKRIVDANNAAIQFYGYNREALLEKTIDDLNTLPPDEINKIMQKAVNAKSSYFEFRHKLANNEIKNVEVYASPIKLPDKTLMFAIVYDITDRKEAQLALQESENRLKTLLNSVPDIICFKDGAGRWLIANDADLKLFQLEDVDYVGKKDSELAKYSPFYYDAFMGCEDSDELAWKKKGVSRLIENIPNLNGGDFIYDIIKVPIFNQDNTRNALVVFGRDITDIKKTEQALLEKNAALTSILNQLEETKMQLVQSEKMASIGILTAGIAHEINNPINFIQAGINSLLRDFKDIGVVIAEGRKINLEADDLKEKILRFKKIRIEYGFNEALESIPEILKDIKLGAERTTAIVKSLRSYVRPNNDNFCLYSIHEGIENSLVLLRSKYKDNIEIVKNLDDSIPQVSCNSGKVNQVFLNLFSNAIDAIPEKGKIFITTKLLAGKISISIKDTGTGIKKELQTKIFDPFYTSKPEGKGMGLGLYIVYGFIQEHNGSIDVISESCKGSEFIIYLPIE